MHDNAVSKVRNVRMDRLLLAGMTWAITSLIIAGFYAQQSMQDIQEATSRRAHARQTAFEINKMNLLLEQAETGQRGFLLTGTESYLEPYLAAKDQIAHQLEQLGNDLRTQPDQLERLKQLEETTKKLIQVMHETLIFKKRGQHETAVNLVKSGEGKIFMDEIRAIIEEMGRIQKIAIDRNHTHSKKIVRKSSIILMISSVIALLITMASALFLLRNQQKRIQTAEMLIETNRTLEAKKELLSHVVHAQQDIVMAGFDIDRVMALVVEHATQITRAAGSVIEILDSDIFIYKYASKEAQKFLGFQIKQQGSFSGLCVREDKALICYDSEEDPRVDREACRQLNIRSMIVAPLKHQSKIIGVLKCHSSAPNAFSPSECESLLLVAGFLAFAFGRSVEFQEKTKIIHDLERTKEQLTLAKDQAESATRAKSQFLANMSHEVRTPLHGILGLSRLLRETPLTGEQKDYIDNLYDAGEGLLKIVNDILDLSKIESGKLELEKIDFDLRSTVQIVQKSFSSACSEKGLALESVIDPQIPDYLNGDPRILRQILINLLGNAIKFTDEGFVKLTIRQELNDEKGVRLKFEIEDSGMGIDPTTIPFLFSEFVQGDVSTTRRFGGTGLGLSLCKRMIEQMNGRISVTSELGQGTKFRFSLVLAEGLRKELPKMDDLIPALDKSLLSKRILVVDDNLLNQKIAVKSLEKLGLKGDVANNGVDALEKMNGNSYDLILMDCQMPVMDGFQTTRQIRFSQTTTIQNVPIVAMTASAMQDEIQRCVEAGMNDFISKPFAFKTFARTVEAWLRAGA